MSESQIREITQMTQIVGCLNLPAVGRSRKKRIKGFHGRQTTVGKIIAHNLGYVHVDTCVPCVQRHSHRSLTAVTAAVALPHCLYLILRRHKAPALQIVLAHRDRASAASSDAHILPAPYETKQRPGN